MATVWKLVLVCCISNLGAYQNLEYSNFKLGKREGDTITGIPLEQSAVPAVTVDTTTPYQKHSSDYKTSIEREDVVVHKLPTDSSMDIKIKNSVNKEDFDKLIFHFDDADNSCLFDNIKTTLMWWKFPNGTLRRINFNIQPFINYVDLSYGHISSDDALYVKIRALEVSEIGVFSAAYNNLTSVPQRALELISSSLKYLTLSGNNFYATTLEMKNDDANRVTLHETNSITNNVDNGENISSFYKNSSKDNWEHLQTEHFKVNKFFSKSDKGIAWAQFPYLPNLIELDVSNCHIEFVAKDAFRNLINLKSLYISHNKMLTIPFDTFYHVQSLQYLDLSHTNVFDYSYQMSMPTLETFINMVYGLKIQQTTFKYLPKIVYLDLSHTKLTRNSAVAFAHLGEKLKYLSLCYTAFPMVGNALFKNTALVGLDLSGNTYAAYNMIDDAFEGVSNTLSVLYFERSNLKDISWIKYLSNLKVLGLAGNNINSITFEMFSPVSSLQVLDLSINHVGNWYNRVFSNNHKLRILNLRDNNINIITSEMLKDFSALDYLSIGDNNFVCDCLLRDIVDLATSNTKNLDCARSLILDAQDLVINTNFNTVYGKSIEMADRIEILNAIEWGKLTTKGDILSILLSQSIRRIRHKIEKTSSITSSKNQNKVQFVFKSLNTTMPPKACQSTETQSTDNNHTLNGFVLRFQLLDYQEEHYWCFNETEKISFLQLACHQRSFAEDVAEKLHNLTIYVVSCVCTLLVISIIAVIIYFKRWHIYYYYSSLKSAALLSEAVKENVDKLSTLSQNEPNMMYDIFISYCQSDREWVLKELIPNIEENGDITICLHERDFQIGVTILDNIISCMDRSRGLMLIISSNFLLSHWCQFEMHLAQHRIFDASNDHLILVFLEDIPRNKRPKHLQYLMDVKTYIKWPGAKSKKEFRLEDHKLFWKRLRRTLNGVCN